MSSGLEKPDDPSLLQKKENEEKRKKNKNAKEKTSLPL